MKIAILLNGISRKKKRFYQRVLPSLRQQFSVNVFETQFANHAMALAREIATQDYDVLLSAGGDGTLNQVVNGVLEAKQSTLPMIGTIPLGSGNDFARMMGITGEPHQLIELLTRRKPRFIDVGEISCFHQGEPVTRYFINVCSMGMGPATVHRLERLPRWLGTAFRYYASVINTFLTHSPEQFEVNTPDWKWSGLARVVAIANGKSFGNGIYIAPTAKPDDGVLSTFIATDLPLLKFLFALQTLKGNKIVHDGRIQYATATQLEIKAPGTTWIETEGELAGILPARIVVHHNRIQFLGQH